MARGRIVIILDGTSSYLLPIISVQVRPARSPRGEGRNRRRIILHAVGVECLYEKSKTTSDRLFLCCVLHIQPLFLRVGIHDDTAGTYEGGCSSYWIENTQGRRLEWTRLVVIGELCKKILNIKY